VPLLARLSERQPGPFFARYHSQREKSVAKTVQLSGENCTVMPGR